MTKKTFQAVADILTRQYEAGNLSDLAQYNLCQEFIALFEEQNPRFDRERFKRACGICSCGQRLRVDGTCYNCK